MAFVSAKQRAKYFELKKAGQPMQPKSSVPSPTNLPMTVPKPIAKGIPDDVKGVPDTDDVKKRKKKSAL